MMFCTITNQSDSQSVFENHLYVPFLAIVEDTTFMFLPQGYPFSYKLNTQLLFGCSMKNLLPLSQLFQYYLIQHALFSYMRDIQIIKTQAITIRVSLVGKMNDPSMVFYVVQ